MRSLNHSLGVVSTFALVASLHATSAAAALTCTVESIQSVVPADTTIVSAAQTAAPVPHCKIDGFVTTTNPGPNKVNFRLQLPEKSAWQGRYYFIGMGGSAGHVPTESQIPIGNPMKMGFAVAGTDTGHQGPTLDWSFLDDPVKTVDHVHRGAHVTAVATQQITRKYYGKDKMYRYHSGCSGGGRMGMEAMQKHPEDYDGVLLGWPGGRASDPKKQGSRFEVMVREITREPGAWPSPAKLKFAEQKVLAACDAADGAKDEMIWDHRLCKFDFKSLKCAAGDQPDCLTQPELTTIENLLRDTQLPISNMGSWGFTGLTPPPWSPDPRNMGKVPAALIIQTTWARTYLRQPDRDIIKSPLTPAELAKMDEVAKEIGYSTTHTPDISGYAKKGGKAIFFVGVSDPCCSNLSNENYFHDIAKQMGGAERVDQFAKLYEIPGMGHCGGGTGPFDPADRLLVELIDWVEKGEKPQAVEMHRGVERAKLLFSVPGETVSGVPVQVPAGGARDFLVCPFPQVSVFDQSKANAPEAVYDARNWECRAKR
jgi:feruloyl esterase